MSYKNCIDAIRESSGKDFTEDEMLDIVEELERRKARIRRDAPLTGDAEALLKAAQEISEEEKVAALIEKRSRAINVLRKKERLSSYANNGNRVDRTLRAMNVGSERTFFGAGRSVDADKNAITKGILGPMIAELRKGGLVDALTKGGPDMDRDIAREMWRATGGIGEATGNRTAEAVAKILSKYQEVARLKQNDAGAFIRQMPGYIVRQSHDMFRIRKAGYEAWRDWITPRLDPKTFDDVKDVEGYMRRVYNNLASGTHLKATGSDWLGGFKGPGNLAKRASQERTLHFKDADSWSEYNERFGARSLFEAVVGGVEAAARNTALMRVWGTNPEAAFLSDLNQLTEKAVANGDMKLADKLKSTSIRHEFDQITGAANIPGSPRLAQVGSTVRALESMSKLGGVVLSSFPDIAIRASTLKYNGVGYLDGIGDGFASILRGRGTAEQREIADMVGAGIDGMLGHILSKFSATDDVPGRMSKLMDTYFRFNLLNFWTDAQATGVGLMLSRNLARNRSVAFSALNADLRDNLIRYGIDEKVWDLVRGREMRAADGVEYLTPDAVEQIDDDAVKSWLGKPDATGAEIRRGREKLQTALQSYFVDQTNEAMTMAGARQRAAITGGTRPGTAWGEAARFIMQFKTYGITFASRHLGRELVRQGQVNKTGLAFLIATTTAMGYLSGAAKDVVKGRTPRDPSAPKTWLSAMMQGGGFGIYGDFLFGEFNRFGGGFAESAAGPTAGSVGDILRVWSAAIRGDDVGASALKAVTGNTPFINLFYTRMILDYAILYHVQEEMNPGYLQRMESRIRKDNAQDFWLTPSHIVARGGGFK